MESQSDFTTNLDTQTIKHGWLRGLEDMAW